ncbi:MAG: helix-turn-helix transcriptional regulator [Deltaproteobacteria bacterium]|nr:helix-turn-helix transcriptional regulator [Deltaproteobacteria bacterium]
MAGNSIQEVVAKNVRFYRLKAGLSQDKLSKKCGLSVRFISRAENQPQNLTLDTLQILAKALDVSVAELTESSEKKKLLTGSAKRTAEILDSVIATLKAVRSTFD